LSYILWSERCDLNAMINELFVLLLTCRNTDMEINLISVEKQTLLPVKADSHIACRAHAVLLPCRAAKGLECVFPI